MFKVNSNRNRRLQISQSKVHVKWKKQQVCCGDSIKFSINLHRYIVVYFPIVHTYIFFHCNSTRGAALEKWKYKIILSIDNKILCVNDRISLRQPRWAQSVLRKQDDALRDIQFGLDESEFTFDHKIGLSTTWLNLRHEIETISNFER